jgi:hypothetical protein
VVAGLAVRHLSLWMAASMKGMNASSRCENIAPSKDESMMMFRPMREEEYPAYLEYFIAREIAANYRLSAEDSLK